MSRIATTFEQNQAKGRKLLIPYVVAGDPGLDVTLEVMHSMVAAGADLLEVGVPFTDPEAEGPVIQLAHERALKNNVSLTDTLELVSKFRATNETTPIILMGYVNPIEAMGYADFSTKAAAAGVDGTIIVNLPPEEGGELTEAMGKSGLSSIYLIAPTTTDARAAKIAAGANGFIYYVSLKGTTGAAKVNFDDVEVRVNHLRQWVDVPMVVGFGIKDGESAARVAEFADGSVVGTAVVSIFEKYETDPAKIPGAVTELLSEMRSKMDAN